MKSFLVKLSSRTSILVLVLICLLAFSLMLWASLTDSGAMDELAHIPAGYGYVHNLDYRLNPEHPPLVKAFAAFPLLFLNPTFPTDTSYWQTDINGQWAMGTKFLYESGNDANELIRVARIGPMLLTILLIILIYLWSRELLGEWWALLPAFLFALSPTVLAHGHYVTTDIGAAFGVVFAVYYFLKFLNFSSRKNLVYSGLALGVAELAKFSAALLVPHFAVLIIVFYLAGLVRDWPLTEAGARAKRFFLRALRYLKYLALIFIIAYLLIVYPVYVLFNINYPAQKQASDTEYILSSFAHGPTPPGATCNPMRCLADLNIWMSKQALTRPLAQYMLGVLMVIQRSAGGNTNYFLGGVSPVGSRLYFPVVYLIKEPLPVIVMVFFALVYCLWEMMRNARNRAHGIKDRILNYLGLNFTEFSMFAFIVLYWAWSIKSPLNIGFRHLLPTLPFTYILTANAWKRWVTKINLEDGGSLVKILWLGISNIFAASLKYILLVFLVFWFFMETIFAAPYFLSYFNEFGGGIASGYRYVTDSNYDWGQDFLRLVKFIDAHPEIDKIAIDYFGAANPKYYLGAKAEGWSSAQGNPADKGIHWLAVSVNTLQGAIQPLIKDQKRKPEDEYRWLITLRPPAPGWGNVPEPDYRAGTSIFIYKL